MTRHPTWLRRLSPNAGPRLRLVCFPHAGGNSAFFNNWRPALSGDVELITVQYPGRMDRIADAGSESIAEMADHVCRELLPLADAPLALFGHSFGAAVAYECALALEARKADTGGYALIVSGRHAPQINRGGTLHLAPDDCLSADLLRLGGTHPEALLDPELRQLILSALRQDYRLSETYKPGHRQPLRAPVLACLADRDPEVTVEEARAWQEITLGTFEMKIFQGDHFYLIKKIPELVSLIFNFSVVNLENTSKNLRKLLHTGEV